jgi:hypothetical protein
MKADLRSTLGRLTDVSQPKPLTKRRIELDNLAGASEMTSLTSSIFRIEVLNKTKTKEALKINKWNL